MKKKNKRSTAYVPTEKIAIETAYHNAMLALYVFELKNNPR